MLILQELMNYKAVYADGEAFKTVCNEINDNPNDFIIKRAIKLMLELEEKEMTHTNKYIECLKLIRVCTDV